MFQNKKLKDIYKQIDASFIEMKNDCPAMQQVWDRVQTIAYNMLKKQESKVVSFFDNYPHTPRVWAITFTSNFCGYVLESGIVHVYRGLLNTEGENYLKVFEYSSLKLAKEGIVSEATVRTNIKALKENILYVG